MTGILFIARLGSTRLSQKHLIKAQKKTFIEWLVDRFREEFKEEIEQEKVRMIIATSDEPENRLFETIFPSDQVEVFYGAIDNIPLRQSQCADICGFDNIISVDGDDILCSPFAARKVWEKLEEGEGMVKTTGLPIGLNVWGYKSEVLRDALSEFKSVTGKLETGWGRIFEGVPVYNISYGNAEGADMRFTLDYPEDANFFKAIIEGLGEKVIKINDLDLIDYVRQNKLNDHNKHLEEQYFQNFNNQKKSE